MASRKTYKNMSQNLERDYSFIKLNDALCPICRSILINPVTLPCNHGFCLTCFKGTIENSNLVCPLCRIRIGSWLRKRKTESQLINKPLWDAISNNYGQHVKNKLSGLEDNLEEEPCIVISVPGEIRKEYEIQKQKEYEEVRKLHEKENKASEELIKKLQQEEDYQKAVMEEKIRLDEEIARRIAAELSYCNPSTSKVNLCKKQYVNSSKLMGPMDRFLKKDNETITSQSIQEENNSFKKFTEKEFTCRVLYLDPKKSQSEVPQTCTPIIEKKIQQIQNSFESDHLNNSFEAAMRYFKPIRKCSLQTNWKPPIKVLPKKAIENGNIKIISPSGMVNFLSSSIKSAFVRIASPSASTQVSTSEYSFPSQEINKKKHFPLDLKRRISSEDTPLSNKIHVEGDTTPTLTNYRKFKITKIIYNKTIPGFTEGTIVTNFEGRIESPPFYGFDNSEKYGTNEIIECETENHKRINMKNKRDDNKKKTEIDQNGVTDDIRINGNLWIEEESYQHRLLQEQADLELAKKLQEEYDRYAHYTRSSRKVGRGSRHRQITLDQIFTGTYKVK